MVTRRTGGTPGGTEPGSRTDAPPRERAGVRAKAAKAAPQRRVQVSPEARHTMIAEAAYLRAERRGFAPGHESEDWLAAELEVDALLRSEHGRSAQ
jgi:hypothetical protein